MEWHDAQNFVPRSTRLLAEGIHMRYLPHA